MDTAVVEKTLELWVSRKSRASHPDGTFDRQGRWYPSESEQQACCNSVRSPSSRWPYSQLVHCRSAAHVAKLIGLEGEELAAFHLSTLAGREKPAKFASEEFYKAVVVVDGRFRSIYEWQQRGRYSEPMDTEYVLGETLTQAVRRGHEGGYYAYSDVESAKGHAANIAENHDLGAAVLRVRVAGQHTTYACQCEQCYWGERPDAGHIKHAVSRITPLEVVWRVQPLARETEEEGVLS